MFKRLAQLFLVAAVLLTSVPFALNASADTFISVTADGINVVRESGMLVIYTPDMGATTDTNEWGNEVVVINNVATRYNSAGNSEIPENGFVVAGHGDSATWITENIPLGIYVYYNSAGLITVTDNPYSGSYSTAYSALNSSRGTDQMIIYTNRGSSTGTNVYGIEVVVTNGYITSVGGNDNTVPNQSNSFVVSGHGSSSDWLSAHATVGMKASYNSRSRTVTFSYDRESLAKSVSLAREEAVSAKETALANGYAYSESAEALLAAAESEYLAADGSFDRTSAESLAAEYSRAVSLFADCPAVEYRGVWVRPTQKSRSEVEAFIKSLYESGINMISVETMYNSTMIYPTAEGSLIKHNPDFNGFDVLGAYVEVCHSYGMELHCWMPVFYSGSTSSSNYSLSTATQKPEWCALTNKGSKLYSDESSGMVFLNPALDEVQDFLAETYTHLLQTYDIDGFQLDYIRYRDRTSTDDYGYDSTTIAKFKEAYPKYKNYTITYNTNALYWSDWVAFRASLITDFVQRMRGIIDTVAPNVVLSADVGPDLSSAYSNLYQNSALWMENGWLDIIHPMAYGEGYSAMMPAFIEAAGEGCMVVPGLGIYMSEFHPRDMKRQTEQMRAVGCQGVVYFASDDFLGKNCGPLLTSTVFAEPAVVPALDNFATIEAVLNRISERIALALSAGTLSQSDAEGLQQLAQNAKISLSAADKATLKGDITALKAEISGLPETALKTVLSGDIKHAAFACLRSLKDDTDISDRLETVVKDGVSYLIVGKGEAPLSVSELKALLAGSTLEKNGAAVSDSASLGTGMLLSNGSLSYTVVLLGDVNGDGKLGGLDYALVKRGCLGTYSLEGMFLISADINGSGKLEATDYALVKRHVLGTHNIQS